MVPYLFLAGLQTTVFSALFVFTDRVLYPVYASAPRLAGISVLEDQRVAGAVMWVPGSFVLLATVMVLVVRLLSPRLVRPGAPRSRATAPARTVRGPVDLLRWPLPGALRRIGVRRLLQGALLVLAAVVVLDGFFGPRIAPMNLAGVLPWTYWRAFSVLALLAAGNLFCMTCPFMLPRALGRRLFSASRSWPVALRSKWLAAGLIVLYLWAYEVLAPWDRPAWTAWIIVGYFAGAFAVDAIFKGASFCKYVCPIGQFNFIGSLVSPLEVRAREASVCASCTTHDCIRGRRGARGCELDLFLPAKVGNLDCTFCLDCVRACPHDNVGVLARVPGGELLADAPRASLGRLSGRLDLAALALVIVFGAFANAAGMVAPVARALGGALSYSAALATALVVLPAGLVRMTRWWLGRSPSTRRESRRASNRLALALVPLGMAMWADHLLIHLRGGLWSAVPAAARWAGDLGLAQAVPDWSLSHAMAAGGEGLLSFQILLLDLGLLASLYLGWRVVRPAAARTAHVVAALAPWATAASLLFIAGVWILFQPMEMRGMLAP